MTNGTSCGARVVARGLGSLGRSHKLVEADADSEWVEALESRDCKNLMHLLKENSSLVTQTALQGRTVLHVAVIQGCLQLIVQILTLFGCGLEQDEFHRRYSVLLTAKDWRCGGVTAWQLATEFVGIKEVNECLLFGPSLLYIKELENKEQDACAGGKLRTVAADTSTIDMVVLPNSSVNVTTSSITSDPKTQLHSSRHQEILQFVRGIIDKCLELEHFKALRTSFAEDVDYNFDMERTELLFHHACKFGVEDKRYELDFVRAVMDACMESGEVLQGGEVLRFLFNCCNAQGRPPLHAILASYVSDEDDGNRCAMDTVLKWLREKLLEREKGERRNEKGHKKLVQYAKDCVNARDAIGRTLFHVAASMESPCGTLRLLSTWFEPFYKDTSVNLRTGTQWGPSALHLAILHNCPKAVHELLCDPKTDLNAMLNRAIVYGQEEKQRAGSWWSPLQLAAVMGQPTITKLLLKKIDEIYDVGKWNNNKISKPDYYGDHCVPALHLATASGNMEVLRLFLDNPHFNQMISVRGCTTLHLAVDDTMPHCLSNNEGIDISWRFILLEDICTISKLESLSKIEKDLDSIKGKIYDGKKGCMSMLLQAGVDIWQKDDDGDIAEPGLEAPDGVFLWWHEKVTNEVSEAKRNLNAAGNAIFVVAGLVATASYVGPLQPPLGYDPTLDEVQVTKLPVRIFVVSNNVSFYLAIASLMFAVMPSLPMSQEGLYDEWRHTQRTVAIAITFLLMSVLGVLISFAAASNAGMTPAYSWHHSGLSFYPTLVCGFFCLIGIVLLFFRVLRLIFPKSRLVKFLYQKCINVCYYI